MILKSLIQKIIPAVLLTLSLSIASAQQVNEPKNSIPEWSQPYPPFRIAGNLYYVGTYDLACYLIITSKGNILINTGLANSATQIKKNIETLGFRFADTKILLTTQAHYDHLGAMAAIKKETGAKLMIDEKDAPVTKDGGSSDYAFGGNGSTFEPIQPDLLLHDNDTIRSGNMQLVLLHHPGHTKGSCSYYFTVSDDQRSYKVLIANFPTIVFQKPFAEATNYPGIADDYAYTFNAMKKIHFDIWLSSHGSQFKLHDKHKPGEAYNPAAFMDQAGYDHSLNELLKVYDKKMGH